MRSISNLRRQDAGIPLLADDVLEFHAARLLLLTRVCGVAGRIDGLTKMAKLDFFVRYPEFFERIISSYVSAQPMRRTVESNMVRFHYGPWDRRYYHVLGYLRAKNLITISRMDNRTVLQLTELGNKVATDLETKPPFSDVVAHMRRVKRELGRKTGSALKRMIYQFFNKEVTERPLGEVIG